MRSREGGKRVTVWHGLSWRIDHWHLRVMSCRTVKCGGARYIAQQGSATIDSGQPDMESLRNVSGTHIGHGDS